MVQAEKLCCFCAKGLADVADDDLGCKMFRMAFSVCYTCLADGANIPIVRDAALNYAQPASRAAAAARTKALRDAQTIARG